jgi:L-alanine-DL-glutamate epimerase-like enolase superfamily enzyme
MESIEAHVSGVEKKLVIDRIEIMPLDLVPARKRKIPTGALLYGSEGSWVGRPVLVRVCAGGLSGWGEVRPVNPFVGESAASMFATLRDFYGPLIVGRNALDIVGILRDCEQHSPANPAALGALDMALHDVVAQSLGVPVHTLLGGACRNSIPMEWSLGLSDEKTMIEEAVMALENYRVPYLCVKVGPASRIEDDVRILAAIRRSVGPDVHLGIDANTTYDPVNAVRLAQRLTDVRLTYFEQPVPGHALSDLKWVYDRANVSVMADESVRSLSDSAAVIDARAVDVIATKIYKCGGVRRCREIAIVADASGMRVNCAGVANGSYIEALAGAHLCASVPNHAFGAEFLMGLPAAWEDPIVKNRPIDTKDGYCNVPQLPGLGCEIDETAVKRYSLAHAVVGGS